MPVINGKTLLAKSPIRGMVSHKLKVHGTSYGLGEAGYDIRLAETILFSPDYQGKGPAIREVDGDGNVIRISDGRFTLASAIEEFDMPASLVGVVHDKSTWARQGLSVFNTVIEPGFKGGLTLEIVFHGNEPIHIPAGAGIAQVLFHKVQEHAQYNGKYQNQSSDPVPAIFEK